MREILFRGKTYNDKWVQGLLVQMDDHLTQIRKLGSDGIGYYDYSIVPSTVGQYTGLTDKNGRKIFEGDIVKFPHGTKSMNGKIEYIEEDCIYYLTDKTGRVPFGVFFNGFELEIIGNIHDNPELLEEATE